MDTVTNRHWFQTANIPNNLSWLFTHIYLYTRISDYCLRVFYGYTEIEDEELWAKGADTAINRKWWDFMADIMETNPDNSPVSEDLHLVFHLDW